MSQSKNRWAGLSVILQMVALFFVEDMSGGRPIVFVPMVLLFVSMLLSLEAWMRGKGWHN